MALAHENAYATFVNRKKEFDQLETIDTLFLKITENLTNTKDYFPAFFLLRTHAAQLAAERLAISGQSAEAYMVMRGAIENALYGHFFYREPSQAVIWLNRHDDEASKRLVRDTFTFGAMIRKLEEVEPNLVAKTRILYEHCIDYGAHPNERTLSSVLSSKEDESTVRFEVGYMSFQAPFFDLCLKSCARVGVCGLSIFALVFPERFALLGISEELAKLKQQL